MSFRTVVISKQAKLSYKNRYLSVKEGNDEHFVHISEIDTVVIDSTAISISTFLLKELSDSKINIIFCDEKHNPFGEIKSFHMNHICSKKVHMQAKWSNKIKDELWTKIVKDKITNQLILLERYKLDNYELLLSYVDEIKIGDKTNREGIAAKVYFSSLFSKKFTRNSNDTINSALNYGYAILLSYVGKEISINGYVSELGIHHKNEFNPFNLACDLMEPFRPIIDEYVYNNQRIEFDIEYKMKLLNLFNQKYNYNNKQYILKDIIQLYVKNIFDYLEIDKKYIGFRI